MNIRAAPKPKLLIALQGGFKSRNLEICDISMKTPVNKIFSFEEVLGSIKMALSSLEYVYYFDPCSAN